MKSSTIGSVFLLTALSTTGAVAQGVIVDQGEFSIEIGGREVGTEEFVLRRAGLGREDAVFANAVVSVDRGDARWEIRPLLRAVPDDGAADSYQVSVTGPDAIEIRLTLQGRRYLATIRSALGDEDREFQARESTRVIESGVAHQYYFLGDVLEGRSASVLEPRTSRQLTFLVSSRRDVQLTLGPNTVRALRVDFTSDDGDDRSVWYDRQGRVLRVEVPSRSYVAVRTDLVG